MEQISATSLFPKNNIHRWTTLSPKVQKICADFYAVDLYDAEGRWADSLILRSVDYTQTMAFSSAALLLAKADCPYFLIRHGSSFGSAEPTHAIIHHARSMAILGKMMGVRLYDLIIESETKRFSCRKAGLL